MKTYFLIIIAVAIQVSTACAQSTMRVGSPVEQASPLSQIKKQSEPPVGSVYMNDDWMLATLNIVKGYLSQDQLKDVEMRLDLRTNTFELKSPSGIKELNGSKVEKFFLLDSKSRDTVVFINAGRFKSDGVSLTGFCKVTGDKVSLARHTSVKFMPADYDVTLNRGSKEDRFVKDVKLYFVKDNTIFPATKKKLFELMGDKEEEIRTFIKQERINVNKEDELSLVIGYYDSLFNI